MKKFLVCIVLGYQSIVYSSTNKDTCRKYSQIKQDLYHAQMMLKIRENIQAIRDMIVCLDRRLLRDSLVATRPERSR